METFKAGVQYGDYAGTAAADDAHARIADVLRAKGILQDGEWLVGLKMWSGENHGGPAKDPYITALIADEATSSLMANAEWHHTPELRTVRLEMGFAEFFGLFKRFDVIITNRAYKTSDKSYIAKDD